MSFQQGLSGLNAAAKKLDVIGNNVANANTAGFKQSEAQFSDIYAATSGGASRTQSGAGTRVSQVVQQFAQGNVSNTTNPLDMAINGAGFFQLSDNGVTTYSRNGQFQLDKDGFIGNASGAKLTGYPIDANNNIVTGAAVPINISAADIAPRQSTTVDALLNLDSRSSNLTEAGFNMNDPATYHSSTSTSVYDSLGNSHILQTYFVKTAPNDWAVFAASDGVLVPSATPFPGEIGQLEFLGDGSINTATTTMPFAASLSTTTGSFTPFNVNIDFEGTTQYGSSFGVLGLSQDGYTSGRLTSFNVGQDGVVTGRYTNGQGKSLAQVVLANFANTNGLRPLGGNAWAESETSGVPLVGAPQSSSLGSLQSSAVEDSNVDMTAELVSMITAQRFYQANAQTIKTQDQVLQTALNLR